jgi:UDP-glucose 4-epimerase
MHDLAGTRVLVTGGAGFVGSNIVDQLLEAGAGQVIVVDNMVRGRLDNLTRAIGSGRVEVVEGDIRDRKLMDRLVAGCDTVFHQAALRITHCAAEPAAAMEVMVGATFDLFRLCVEHEVRKVIYASSASIYGLAQTFPTREDHHPYDNRTLYGAAKSFGEGLLRSFHDMYTLDYVGLRYFNVYGPRMDLHGRYTEVMVRWMERIEAGEPPLIFGDGLQTMDMIHVRDVARANILAAQSDVTDRVFNVGSGTETSLLDLARALSSTMGRPDLVPVHLEERAVNPVPRRLAATSDAATFLGFRSQVRFEAGVAELVDWWRSKKSEFFIEEKAS